MLLLYAVATKKTLVIFFPKKLLFLYGHPSNTFDFIFGCFEKDWKITKFLCGFNSSFFIAANSIRAANSLLLYALAKIVSY